MTDSSVCVQRYKYIKCRDGSIKIQRKKLQLWQYPVMVTYKHLSFKVDPQKKDEDMYWQFGCLPQWTILVTSG